MDNQDDADRTLPPTERRRREARLRGEVPRSAELTSATLLLAACLAFRWLGPAWVAETANWFRNSLAVGASFSFQAPDMAVLIPKWGQVLVTILGPIGLIVLVAGLMANVIQTGWIWNPAAIQPRFRPRPLISWERCWESGGLMMRLVLLAGLTWWYVISRLQQILLLGLAEPVVSISTASAWIGELSTQLSLLLFVLALFDYGFCFWKHEQRLKMTADERRREQHEDEIDPRIKQRRIADRRQLGSVPQPVDPIGLTID